MTARSDALRQRAMKVVQHHAGSNADAAAFASAAHRAYDDLARVSTPLIGRLGIDALTSRAVHLAQRKYPWLAHTTDLGSSEGPFGQIVVDLERQDAATAAEAAADVLATVGGLLVTLIGEGLSARLLRAAWPTGFIDEPKQEKRTP